MKINRIKQIHDSFFVVGVVAPAKGEAEIIGSTSLNPIVLVWIFAYEKFRNRFLIDIVSYAYGWDKGVINNSRYNLSAEESNTLKLMNVLDVDFDGIKNYINMAFPEGNFKWMSEKMFATLEFK